MMATVQSSMFMVQGWTSEAQGRARPPGAPGFEFNLLPYFWLPGFLLNPTSYGAPGGRALPQKADFELK
jgi:hypothetical protein